MRPKVKPEESIRRMVRAIKRDSARILQGVVDGSDPEATNKWMDRSARLQVATIMVGHHEQAERVKQTTQAPQMFGVVFMPAKAASIDTWERDAIEAVEIPALGPLKAAK